MSERVGQLARIVAFGVCLIGTSHLDGGTVVLAQRGDTPANAVSTGEFLIEPPTLINLGFEWFIQGDDNRNAAVEVSYRRQGETAWSPALPLLRLQGERVFVGAQFDVVAPNMFAGSIIDLEPDTAYEARFVMTDPDGVIGAASKTVTVRTRAEPVPYAEGKSVARLSPWLRGHEDRAVVRGVDMCVQLLMRWWGLRHSRASPGARR